MPEIDSISNFVFIVKYYRFFQILLRVDYFIIMSAMF
jgi:hypothetical protein